MKMIAVEMGGDSTPSPDGDPIAFPISAGMKFKQIQWIPCLNYTRGRRLSKNLIACSFAVITKEVGAVNVKDFRLISLIGSVAV